MSAETETAQGGRVWVFTGFCSFPNIHSPFFWKKHPLFEGERLPLLHWEQPWRNWPASCLPTLICVVPRPQHDHQTVSPGLN